MDAAEGQKIFQLLARVLYTRSIPERFDKDLVLYWKSRFNPARSHLNALSNIPDVRKKLALPIESDLPRLNEKRATTESEVASDKSSQPGRNQSLEPLVQSTDEQVSKRRGCWGWAWF